MISVYKNDLFIRAARGERTARPPVWLMRQAGRTDPEYNRVKEAARLPLEALFRHPELAAEISLLPKRIGVDAIIFFQDILTPLSPMGCDFMFRPGPSTDTPIRSKADVDRLRLYDVAHELPFIREAFRRIYDQLDGEMPAIGFAGAPLTLLVFMVQGKSFGEVAPESMAFLREEPAAAHALLDKLTAMTIDYLAYQIESGAAAVQLFESAADLLTQAQYREFALPYQQRIFEALRGKAPTIVFARGWDDLPSLKDAGADIVSLPSTVTIPGARRVLGRNQVVQGNIDNHFLVTATKSEIEAAVRECIEGGERRGHIVNLSHGLLRETPFENVCHLVHAVRACET